jgi:hypothetical protein
MIMRHLALGIAAVVCLVFVAGCASSVPPPKRTAVELPLSRSIPGPAGWIDVTDKALSPDVDYWLLAGDRSASLLLRELLPSTSAGPLPPEESLVTLAQISLRLKLAAQTTGLHVTQAPAMLTNNTAFAVYAYAENGLLRRVVVFRKHSRVYELELAQENETVSFSRHLAAQITFAMSVINE